MDTIGKKWARQRNHGKMRFAAMLSVFTDADVQSILVDAEKTSVKNMKVYLEGMLKRWDSNTPESKKVYLSRNIV